jgi:hypothetical protein
MQRYNDMNEEMDSLYIAQHIYKCLVAEHSGQIQECFFRAVPLPEHFIADSDLTRSFRLT